ncbi:ATP-dependent RNA helicase dbp2 [Rhodosporidiobolus nylandii]
MLIHSGAGAGIQADLKAISALECYGVSAITALTAQNSLGVQGVEGVSPGMVGRQIDAVLSDMGAQAVKTGMLFGAETIRVVCERLAAHYGEASQGGREKARLVVDPVCVSTSGHSLLPLEAVDTLREVLLPWATVVTPNIPEGEFLCGWEKGSIRSVEDMERCAAELGKKGVRWVYLKGGHMPVDGAEGKKVVVDLLWDAHEGEAIKSERPFLDVKNTHGTGCTLSAAIASELAKGATVPQAVSNAGDYVASAISASYPVGAGAGPVNHFHSLMTRTLPLPTPHHPRPFETFLLSSCPDAWSRYTNHPFPNSLADGTCKREAFLEFIVQDYHFLKQYARANALSAYKTEDPELLQGSIEIVQECLKETEMHVKFCETFGISHATLLSAPESVTNTAYTRFVLDVTMRGDLLDALVVKHSCLLGYGVVGARLCAEAAQGKGVQDKERNPYWEWVAEYGGEWYQGAVQKGAELLEKALSTHPVSAPRLKELARLFEQATELEIAFWDAAVAAGEKGAAQGVRVASGARAEVPL